MDDLRLFGRSVPAFHFCAGVFAAAYAFRMAVALVTGSIFDPVPFEPGRIALSLIRHGAYADPLPVPTGPTAIVPPAYPLILAAILKPFGGVGGMVAKAVLTWIVGALRAALVPALALRLGLGSRVAAISGVLGVFWLTALDSEVRGEFGSPWEAPLLIALTWLAYRGSMRDASPRNALLFGILCGITALFNPAVVTVLAAYAAIALWQARGAALRRVVLVAAGAVLVMLPWAVRNRAVLGAWIWTRSNPGLELWCSYHPGAHWNLLENRRGPEAVHPAVNMVEAGEMRRLGEVAYDRRKLDQAIAFIRANPGESSRLLLRRTVHFWFPVGRTAAHSAVSAVFTLLAFGGLFFFWREKNGFPLYISALLVVFPLTYYVFQWSSRYRVPVEWALVLLASIAIARLAPSASRPEPG